MARTQITTGDIALPPVNHEMKELDRSFFRRNVRLAALTVTDPRQISAIRNTLSSTDDLFLSSQKVKAIIEDESAPGAKAILLRPRVDASDPSTWKEPWKGLIDDGTVSIRPYDLELKYDDWSMREILDAILPEDLESDESPAGFAQVGHVAHLNLRNHLLPYKHLIGQVLLDKNVLVKTVINKKSDVGSESIFRTFPYEVLAGKDDLNVTVNHLNCEFKFNFAEVYWNIRNSHEHERLLEKFNKGEAVCDVMAGVGPYAIPAAKKGVWVWANDLNPAAWKALQAIIKHNKVKDNVRTRCQDGVTFIKHSVAGLLQEQRVMEEPTSAKLRRAKWLPPAEHAKLRKTKRAVSPVRIREPPTFDHFIMNLPATAVEFLHAFKGIYHGQEALFSDGGRKLPFVHLYIFQARRDVLQEEHEELRRMISIYLDHELKEDEIEFQRVRLVAPSKAYYCASFRLPGDIAFAAPQCEENSGNIQQPEAVEKGPDTNYKPFSSS